MRNYELMGNRVGDEWYNLNFKKVKNTCNKTKNILILFIGTFECEILSLI